MNWQSGQINDERCPRLWSDSLNQEAQMGGKGSGAAASSVFTGAGWFVFWLFTVAFAQLGFGKALLAIFIWPYYLGAALS